MMHSPLYTDAFRNKVKPEYKDTFGHAFLYHYEHLINEHDSGGFRNKPPNMDKILIRLFFQDVDAIIAGLNNGMPPIEEIKVGGAGLVQEYVGPQFHKDFRQIDVLENGHLDMAVHIALRTGAELFWRTLQEMSLVVEKFARRGKGDWTKYIEDIRKEYVLL